MLIKEGVNNSTQQIMGIDRAKIKTITNSSIFS